MNRNTILAAHAGRAQTAPPVRARALSALMRQRHLVIAVIFLTFALASPGHARAQEAGSPTPPAVTGLSPGSGSALGGTTVTITGSGFTGATTVSFDGNATSSFTVASDSTITTVSPPGNGLAGVTVTAPAGTSAAGPDTTFVYVPVPVVSGLTPSQGSVSGGTIVLITGSGFTNASDVRFGNAASSFTVVSDTEITATTPDQGGTVDVRVTTPGGTSAASADDRFTFVVAVTSVSSGSGPTAGGDRLTITGIGFLSVTGVRFGDSYAGYAVVSDTEMLVESPPGSGDVTVRAITPYGTSEATSRSRFNYLTPPLRAQPSVNAQPPRPPAAPASPDVPTPAQASLQTRPRAPLLTIVRATTAKRTAAGAVVLARAKVSRSARLLLRVLDPNGQTLRLAEESRLGSTRSRTSRSTIQATIRAGAFPILLHLSSSQLRKRAIYRIKLTAQEPTGSSTTLMLHFKA